jgi:hypothetical protein
MILRLPSLATLAAALIAAAPGRADDALRRELDRTFSEWRGAMATHSLEGWRQSTAASRQMATRNLIVSQKQPFPEALFNFPLRAPETTTMRFVKAEARGPTAHLVYFGKVEMGIPEAGEVPDNLLVLKFISEAGRWKFDTLRLVNLANSPDVRATLKNGGSTAFLDEPEIKPTGTAPDVPKPCPPPDHIAALQVMSLGYSTNASVNGFALPVVADAAEQHIIIGGLKDGENALKLEVKPTPVAEGSARHLQVNAIIYTTDPKRRTIKVFTWKPPGETAPEFTEQKIFVNKITMRPD